MLYSKAIWTSFYWFSLISWPYKNTQNKWQSVKIHLIIADIQVNKQDKTKIFHSKIFYFIAKSSSVQELKKLFTSKTH